MKTFIEAKKDCLSDYNAGYDFSILLSIPDD